MFLQQSQKCKRLGTSTYSMLTVDRRCLLEWTYFAELSHLPLKRQEIAVTAATALYIIASQDGGSLRILPLILNLRNDVIVNARSQFTYQDVSGATAVNLCSLFRGQKLLKLLTVGYALPEMPFSVGNKLELLWAVFAKLPYISPYTHALVSCLLRGAKFRFADRELRRYAHK